MAVVPKDPFDWVAMLELQVDEVLDYVARIESRETFGECDFVPPMDIYETPDAFSVEIDLPGFDRSEISLKICRSTLIVEGKKQEDAQQRGVTYRCLERRFGRFCRTVELPPAVETADSRAEFRNGVLSVRFPRRAEAKKMIRDIPIVQGDDDGQ